MKFLKFPSASIKEYKTILTPSLFIWTFMAGLAIGRAANDTLFIGQSGAANLPRVFIFNAIVLSFVSFFYSILEKRMPRFSLLIWLLVFFALLLSLLRSQLHSGYWWLPYAVFCYYEVLILVVHMHFWTCLNDIFGPREGKKLFPIMGAIGLCGTIFGGLFTWLASPLIGYHNLFFVWIFLLLCAVPIAIRMRRNARNAESRPNTSRQGGYQNMKEIWRLPLVRYLALISIPLWLVVHTVDWLFYLAIEEMFTNQPDKLSSFLGLLSGVISFLGVLLQLFITGPLLRKVGVGLAYSLYSLSMTMGAFFLFLRTFLPINTSPFSNLRAALPVMTRFLDESVFFSIYDSALQLLYGALPTAIRGQARALIYGIMETGTTALAGLVLSLVAAFAVPHEWIAGSAFFLGLIWVFSSLKVHKYYLNTLSLNLNSRDPTMHSNALNQIRKTKITIESRELFLQSVYSGDEDVSLLALLYIKNLKDQQSLIQLGKNISKCKGVGFHMTLQLLSEYKVVEALPSLKRIYVAGDDENRAAALACIGKIEPNYIHGNLSYFLESSNHSIRGTAILAILSSRKRLDPKNPALQALKKMIASPREELQLESVKILNELNKKIFTPLLIDLSKSSHPSVKTGVIKAMGHYKHSEISNFLIKEMEQVKSTHLLNNSLIRQGKSCVSIAHKEVRKLKKDPAKNFSKLQNIIYCLGEIGEGQSAPPLNAFLGPKSEHLERVTIKALSKIAYKNKTKSPKKTNARPLFSKSLRLQVQKKLSNNNQLIEKIERYIQSLIYIEAKEIKIVLKAALERSREHSLYIALKCLEILHNPVRVRAIQGALRSNDRRQRSEAIEILEGLGEEGKRLSRSIERRYRSSHGIIRNPVKLFRELSKIKNFPWLSVCMIYGIGELGLKSLSGLVESFGNNPDKMIQNAKALCLAKLYPSSTSAKKLKEQEDMSMNMERIFFLRSVGAFSDVDASDLQWISEIISEIEVKAGEYIFHEGESGDIFHIVKEGEVQIHKGDLILETVHPREYFGEIAIFDREPRTASALAKEHTTLLSIYRSDFQRLLFAKPEIALAMFKTISHRLREVTKKIAT